MNTLKRKYSPTSSDSSGDFDAETRSMSIEEFLAGKDEWRVGAENFRPVHYPYGIAGFGSEKTRNALSTYENEIRIILATNNIEITKMLTQSLFPRDEPSECIDTLIIRTSDDAHDKRNWRTACAAIFKLLTQQGGLDQSQFRVEIINHSRAYQDVSSCLKNDPALLQSIKSTKSAIFDAVEAHLPDHVTNISWVMRGPRGAPSSSLKPTVVIGVKKHSCTGFEFAEDSIRAKLDTISLSGPKLHVEILRGRFVDCAPPSPVKGARKRLDKVTQSPENGSSIGLRNGNKDEGAGTLGGWVVFEDRDGLKRECLMTCYHVIQDGDIQRRVIHDRDGISLNGQFYASRRIEVAYPANCDADVTRTKMEEALPDAEDNTRQSLKSQLDLLKVMEGKSIGAVLLASGHRRLPFPEAKNPKYMNRRLDYALVESRTTFAKNKPPPSGSVSSWPAIARPQDAFYTTGPTEYTTETAEPKYGEWLVKQGRSSFTSGNLNIEPSLVKWNDQKWTSELVICGLTYDFACPGDSGSWVFNVKKQLVGLLFGRTEDDCDRVMTPISVIIEDIERSTGGKVFLS